MRGNWINLSVGCFLHELLLGLGIIVMMFPLMIAMISFMAVLGSVNHPEFTGLPLLLMLLGMYVLMFAAMFVVGGPLQIGLTKMHLDAADGKSAMIGDLFCGFKHCFGRSVGLYLLYTLVPVAIVLPGSLIVGIGMGIVSALIPPENGVWILISGMGFLLMTATAVIAMVVTYRYALSFWIMAEYPQVRPIDALRNSARLMKGNKWRLFCLQFSFIGWSLLAMLVTMVSCGIGSIAMYPLSAYMTTSTAVFYSDVANRQAPRETVFPDWHSDDKDTASNPFANN